jgi:hypothetical protein
VLHRLSTACTSMRSCQSRSDQRFGTFTWIKHLVSSASQQLAIAGQSVVMSAAACAAADDDSVQFKQPVQSVHPAIKCQSGQLAKQTLHVCIEMLGIECVMHSTDSLLKLHDSVDSRYTTPARMPTAGAQHTCSPALCLVVCGLQLDMITRSVLM